VGGCGRYVEAIISDAALERLRCEVYVVGSGIVRHCSLRVTSTWWDLVSVDRAGRGRAIISWCGGLESLEALWMSPPVVWFSMLGVTWCKVM
jgi:hypothetical protein